MRLEFDRERYAPDGTWLAYVYLPNGRMLNAELIRVGFARPRAEAQNVRYLDLFEEIWSAGGSRSDPRGAASASSPDIGPEKHHPLRGEGVISRGAS